MALLGCRQAKLRIEQYCRRVRVSTSVTSSLNSTRAESGRSATPFSFASDFFSEPR